MKRTVSFLLSALLALQCTVAVFASGETLAEGSGGVILENLGSRDEPDGAPTDEGEPDAQEDSPPEQDGPDASLQEEGEPGEPDDASPEEDEPSEKDKLDDFFTEDFFAEDDEGDDNEDNAPDFMVEIPAEIDLETEGTEIPITVEEWEEGVTRVVVTFEGTDSEGDWFVLTTGDGSHSLPYEIKVGSESLRASPESSGEIVNPYLGEALATFEREGTAYYEVTPVTTEETAEGVYTGSIIYGVEFY